ncbi:MAG: DNA polymerase III subunit gamma/tau [Syntrophobacterales bacterium]|nr:DNA polymerase III subunit gamma/tau [Syntrophobacterales bacterium]
MDYLVLARKWRPQVFEDVVGQDHVVKTLKNAIRRDRVAHALIFSGPRGIGKTSVARILAKALNCEKGPAETPCNECTNCKEITEGVSMDVREIDGASNRGIDEVRELRENVKFSPLTSRYKVYIIDEVHMLTKEAFNALLKTIEEPPPHVIFMFATTEVHRVPATILSRCQRHEFRRMSIKQISATLRKIATAEGIEVSDAGLSLIAEGAEGSLRDAESIFDQVISYAGTVVKDGDVETLLGFTDRKLLYDISRAVIGRDARAALGILDEGYYAGLDMKQFYQMLQRHFMNLLLVKVADGAGRFIDLPDFEVTELKKQVGGASGETLQRLLDILMAEDEEVRKSLDPKLNLEFILVKMASLEPLIPVHELLDRVEGMERRLTGKAQPLKASPIAPKEPEREKAAPTEMPVAEPAAGDLWEGFKETVKKRSNPLWSMIEPGSLVGYEKGCLRIGFPKGYVFLDHLNDPFQKDRLAAIGREFFGEEVTVKIEAGVGDGSITAPGNGLPANGGNNDIKKEALNHPMVQKVMNIFEGAEIKEIITRKQTGDPSRG